MKKVLGLSVTGYCTGYGDGLSTCGLADIAHFINLYTDLDNEQILKTLIAETTWSQKKTGNFVFAVTSTQIRERKGFLKWFLEHENTQIVHYYTNNAHGPNIVFICMHHAYPEAVKALQSPITLEWVNKHLEFKDGVYILSV